MRDQGHGTYLLEARKCHVHVLCSVKGVGVLPFLTCCATRKQSLQSLRSEHSLRSLTSEHSLQRRSELPSQLRLSTPTVAKLRAAGTAVRSAAPMNALQCSRTQAFQVDTNAQVVEQASRTSRNRSCFTDDTEDRTKEAPPTARRSARRQSGAPSNAAVLGATRANRRSVTLSGEEVPAIRL